MFTRKELEKEVEKMPNASDRFLTLALFEGIGWDRYRDFLYLTADQFGPEEVMLPSGRRLCVSQLLVEEAKRAAEEYCIRDDAGTVTEEYRSGDRYVIKDMPGEHTQTLEDNLKKMTKRLAALTDRYGERYTYAILKGSGRIAFIKNCMEEDGSTNVMETCNRHRDEMEYRYGRMMHEERWLEEHIEDFPKSTIIS